ncbi:MAG TPA: flagellar hook-length control protein FliK [Nitrosospira sp.]|nr:flagellar hook-length control protein FliK [Nitrosospira sp.]
MLALKALNALARVSAGALLARRQPGEPALLAGLEPGRRLGVRVLGKLHNGEFLVELAARHPAGQGGQAVQMQLPAGVRPGDLLNLVFVSREPRPTFMIAVEDPLLPSGVSSRVSDAGRFIDQLLRQPATPAGLTTLSSAGSLLVGPPLDSVQLAKSLAGALDRSGFFYESHQAQWVAGLRSLPRLLLEPQARLSSEAGLAPAGREGTGPGSVIGGEGWEPAAFSTAAGTPGTSGAAGANDPVHPAALALVRQQLDILETRQFALQGMAWPGQVITWEAAQETTQDRGEPDGRNPGERGQATAWRTTVRLVLPRLGPVTASLRLDKGVGCTVDVRLAAAEAGTVAALRAGVAPLEERLKAAGIELMSMEAEHDEAS